MQAVELRELGQALPTWEGLRIRVHPPAHVKRDRYESTGFATYIPVGRSRSKPRANEVAILEGVQLLDIPLDTAGPRRQDQERGQEDPASGYAVAVSLQPASSRAEGAERSSEYRSSTSRREKSQSQSPTAWAVQYHGGRAPGFKD
jgi:hypothetical protein